MNKNFLKKVSGVAAILAGALASTWTTEASALPIYDWNQIDNGLGSVDAKAAVYIPGKVLVLDGNDEVLGAGYRIRQHGVFSANYSAATAGDGRGTSLAVDETHRVYVIARDNRVWFADANNLSSWSSVNTTRCSGPGQLGGNIVLRQTLGYNNVSASAGNLFVIDNYGRIFERNWTRSCWYRQPALPSGAAVSIATSPNDANGIWAINADKEIYQLNPNATWSELNGQATRLGARGLLVGGDSTSIWTYSESSGVFLQISSWIHGAVKHLFQTNSGLIRTAITSSGAVYYGTTVHVD